MSKSTYLTAEGNRFTNLTAYKGAGFFFDAVETWPYTIKNNTFFNCTA